MRWTKGNKASRIVLVTRMDSSRKIQSLRHERIRSFAFFLLNVVEKIPSNGLLPRVRQRDRAKTQISGLDGMERKRQSFSYLHTGLVVQYATKAPELIIGSLVPVLCLSNRDQEEPGSIRKRKRGEGDTESLQNRCISALQQKDGIQTWIAARLLLRISKMQDSISVGGIISLTEGRTPTTIYCLFSTWDTIKREGQPFGCLALSRRGGDSISTWTHSDLGHSLCTIIHQRICISLLTQSSRDGATQNNTLLVYIADKQQLGYSIYM